MNNVEKATMLAKQVKPCTDDFYSGFYQGALIALNATSNEKNLNEEVRKDSENKNCELSIPVNNCGDRLNNDCKGCAYYIE